MEDLVRLDLNIKGYFHLLDLINRTIVDNFQEIRYYYDLRNPIVPHLLELFLFPPKTVEFYLKPKSNPAIFLVNLLQEIDL